MTGFKLTQSDIAAAMAVAHWPDNVSPISSNPQPPKPSEGTDTAEAPTAHESASPAPQNNIAGIVAANTTTEPAQTEEERLIAEADANPVFEANNWATKRFKDFKPKERLYGPAWTVGYYGVTAGLSGIGKTLLGITECLAMATGRNLTNLRSVEGATIDPTKKRKKRRVGIYVAEDDLEDMELKVMAACVGHNIPLSELDGQLFVVSGLTKGKRLVLFEQGNVRNELAWMRLKRDVKRRELEALMIDPLANVNRGEETNDSLKILGEELQQFAAQEKIAINVFHHTRKTDGRELTIEDVRGGSALVGTARHVRLIDGLSLEQASLWGVEDPYRFMKISAAEKSNTALALGVEQWFSKESHHSEYPETIPFIKPCERPTGQQDISLEIAIRIQSMIREQEAPRWRKSDRSNDWLGWAIAAELGQDPDTMTAEERAQLRSRLRSFIGSWIAQKVVRVVIHKDKSHQDREFFECGENDLRRTDR